MVMKDVECRAFSALPAPCGRRTLRWYAVASCIIQEHAETIQPVLTRCSPCNCQRRMKRPDLLNQRNISRRPVPVVEAGKLTDPSGAESWNDTSCASCKSALIVASLVTTASTAGKQRCSKSLREPCDVEAKGHTNRLLGTASVSNSEPIRFPNQSQTSGPNLFCRWARFASVSLRPVVLDLGV
jgi:hypothetical protein